MKIIQKVIPLLLIAILLFTGCSTTDTYESLYEEYCQKITDTSPIILQEFMDEAEPIKDDSQALSRLYNDKMEKFAKIPAECSVKMGGVMISNKDDFNTCKEWTDKIFEFYQKEVNKLSDAYLDMLTEIIS